MKHAILLVAVTLFGFCGASEISGRRMAWAHYVPWIKPENASLAADRFYNFPLAAVDESESRLVSTRREIKEALSFGLDGWFVDLGANAPNGRMNSSWDMIDYLNAATGTCFQVGICIDGRASADYFARELTRLLKAFGDHPNYPKMNGRPVVAAYTCLRHHPPEMWSELMKLLREEGIDPYLMLNGNPSPRQKTEFDRFEACLDAFEALYMFDAPGHAADPPEVTNRELRDWCAAHGKLAVPSLYPGYIGGWMSGNNDYYHPFRGVDMLHRMYLSARTERPLSWVHVTTWNDLVETAMMPCVFTPGVMRLVQTYCADLKGEPVAAERVRLNFAYHREELAGTLLRIEAMMLPRNDDAPVTVSGVLTGRDGQLVRTLEPRILRGTDFVRCEWLVPTAEFADQPAVTPRFTVKTGEASRTAPLPSVNLVTGWLKNQVTVNVAFEDLVPSAEPRLTVTQKADVLEARLDVAPELAVKRAILFCNDRPAAVFRAERDWRANEYERIVRMDRVDEELTLSVTNGRVVRAVKNYERNGRPWWRWNARGVVTKRCPKSALHALVLSGGRDLAVAVATKTPARLDYDGPDFSVLNAPFLVNPGSVLIARRQMPKPEASDCFWVFLETTTGMFCYTPVIHPFDAERRLVERTILETSVSLETSCGGSGYALRNDLEFLSPEDVPLTGNRLVKCRLPLAGSRRAEWNLGGRKEPFELPRRVWPQGTQRIRLRLKPEGGHSVRQTIVAQEGWSDGVTLALTEDGRVEMIRRYRLAQQTGEDRACGQMRLAPDVWHEVVVEGDMEEIRLLVDGQVDARMKPSPVRCFELCRITIGGRKSRDPFFGEIDTVSISGL